MEQLFPPAPDLLAATAPGPASREGPFLDRLSSAAELVTARRFGEAEDEVLRALALVPADVRALKLLALVRFKLGRLEEARAVCREITVALPEDAGIRLKLGLIALRLGRLDEAVHELELSARLAPEDPRIWSYLGFVYARRGEGTRAAAAFRRGGQESQAQEVERGGIPAVAGVPFEATAPAGLLTGALVGAAATAGAGGGIPLAAAESPFDASVPIEQREGRTDPDRFLASGASGAVSGAVPVTSLVGYAVSRLAPPAAQPSWVGATARFPIGEEIFVRGDAAVACTGHARWEVAQRRVRGRTTTERLGGMGGADGEPFFRVTGRGEVFVGAPTGRLVPLLLEDDVLYVREDRVLAFEGGVPWEYGHVPRGGIRMLQFRGRGLVAIRVDGEPGAVKVTPERPLCVSTPHLLGWIGHVVAHGGGAGDEAPGDSPRQPAPGEGAGGGAFQLPFQISCEGEGVVLVDVRAKDRS